MIRLGVTWMLWLAIAALVIVNNVIGDTFIAERLTAMAVEWYKVLVPLPYVVLMAAIHARRTAGPNWLQAATVASINWPPSTMLVDYLYGRLTFGEDLLAYFGRFNVQWGAPYPLLLVTLFAAPLIAGWAVARR